MTSHVRRALTILLLFFPALLFAEDLPTIESKTEGLTRMDGFFPLYWDEDQGTLWLEIPRTGEDFLYLVSLPAGLGSNDIGLDRGLLGDARVVRFERVGRKMLLVAPNLRYRAESENPAEVRAVRDAFAEGILWGFTVEARTDERALVKADAFLLRDVMGVAQRLKASNQGTFTLNASRSALHPAMIKSFPKNTEMEARLTFTSSEPGGYVRSVAAEPEAVTLRMRQSFIELPDEGYTPRAYDPRSGFNAMTYVDYATPIGTMKERRFLVRHRLERADPAAERSPAVEPIVYYLDPGTPEPVRSALLDGARWWNEAFEAAGYVDAFRVEMLPDDADPMDIRYHMIQWVHRSTRGWSYGRSVVDPRTGEIIKGHVSLGSLRVRQDYLLAEGLLAPYDEAGTPPPGEDPMLDMALARLRQLSAHEVGHTLGLTHNFAASADGRASVMDYPAPLAAVAGEDVSLADAYDTGIGAWDKAAIRFGYTDFPDNTDEHAGLEALLEEARDEGLGFISDTDARPQGGAHPAAHLWDNGADVVEALDRTMAVREVALRRFGAANLEAGRPMAMLEEVLVPLYLHHRYQVEATVKAIGGVDYTYTLRGSDEQPPQPADSALQHAALDALLRTLTPEALRLPESARRLLPPRPPGFGPTRELFDGHTGLVFDPVAPAGVASALVLGLITHPERAARLVYQHDADPRLPGLLEALDTVTEHLFGTPVASDAYDAELQRIVQAAWVEALTRLARASDAAFGVRARTLAHLDDLRARLASDPGADPETSAHRALLAADILRFLGRDLEELETRTPLTTPPGSPIGMDPFGCSLP